MFKYFAFISIIASVLAKPGVLSPSLSIASAPAIVSAPRVEVLRTAPITTIDAPLAIGNGLVASGLLSDGLVSGGGLLSNGLLPSGLVSSGVLSSGVLSSGLIPGGAITSSIISKDLVGISKGLVSGSLIH